MALIIGKPVQGAGPAYQQQGNPQGGNAMQGMPGAQQNQFQEMEPAPDMQSPYRQEKPKKDSADPRVLEIVNDISSLTRRFRVLEERYVNMRKRAQLTDQNMLTTNKKTIGEIKHSEDEIAEMRRKVDDINDKFLLMEKEIELCVRKNELDVLRRYVDFWHPMNFVTQQEAEKIIRNVIEAVKQGKPVERYPTYAPAHAEDEEADENELEEPEDVEESEEEEDNETDDDVEVEEDDNETSDEEETEEDSKASDEDELEDDEEDEEVEEKPKPTSKNAGKPNLDDVANFLHRR